MGYLGQPAELKVLRWEIGPDTPSDFDTVEGACARCQRPIAMLRDELLPPNEGVCLTCEFQQDEDCLGMEQE